MSAETSSSPPEPEFVPADLAPERKQAIVEFMNMSGSMDVDPLGVFDVGKDGVLRSLTADRKVLGAAPLEPRHIKGFLDRLPYDAETERRFRGIDGTKIPQEQWFSPPPGTLPAPLRAEKWEDGKRRVLARGGSLDIMSPAKRRERRDPTTPRCPIVIRSDHNLQGPLGPKEDADAGSSAS